MNIDKDLKVLISLSNRNVQVKLFTVFIKKYTSLMQIYKQDYNYFLFVFTKDTAINNM